MQHSITLKDKQGLFCDVGIIDDDVKGYNFPKTGAGRRDRKLYWCEK